MRAEKRLFIVGVAVQVLLCLLALQLYKERLVLPDAANYLFELLSSDGGFAVFHNRFIALPTQLLPWLAIRAGSSLETVARLYSLNIELFHLGCMLLCAGLRSYRPGIALLLCRMLFTTDTFYWPLSELALCISLLFLLLAIMQRESLSVMDRLAIAALSVTLAFGHSLALFPLAFMLCLAWQQGLAARRAILFTAACYLLALGLKSAFFRDPYDQGALGGLRNFQRLFPEYLSTPALRAFLLRCTNDFVWIPLSLAMVTGWLLHRRQWRPAVLAAGAIAGYVLLTTICFPAAMAARFYQENLFQPLAVFLVLPLGLTVLPALQKPALTAMISTIVILTGVARIVQHRGVYRERLAWQRTLIKTYRGQKVIIPESTLPGERYLMSWSSPYEFWLLSALETGSAASIMITKDPQEAESRAGGETKAFLPAFGLYGYDRLPAAYFPFLDTAQSYRIVSGR